MDCTIIISHYESLPFLRACVRQIRKYKHPEIVQHIIIADQSRNDSKDGIYYLDLLEEFPENDITVCQTMPLYSGYGIDWIMRNVEIKTEYICQIHVDAFPIHKNWLYLPIKLIKENGYTFVGQDHFISKPTDTIYPTNSKFYSMSPTYNVARTDTYREMSLEAGFTRYHERAKTDLIFNNNDWEEWAKEDYGSRGSDDDVVAFCWEDNHREHNKLGLAITGIMGRNGEPGYGRIIEDLVFHFGSCRESIGVMPQMGEKYSNWTKRINNGFSDKLIDEMLKLAMENFKGSKNRIHWDGEIKEVSNAPEELNQKIEKLKNA